MGSPSGRQRLHVLLAGAATGDLALLVQEVDDGAQHGHQEDADDDGHDDHAFALRGLFIWARQGEVTARPAPVLSSLSSRFCFGKPFPREAPWGLPFPLPPRLPAGLGTGLSQAGGFHGPAEAGGDGACRLGRESGAVAGARGTAPPAAGSQNAERSRGGELTQQLDVLLADPQRVGDPAHGPRPQQVVAHAHRQVAGDVLVLHVLVGLRGGRAARGSAPRGRAQHPGDAAARIRPPPCSPRPALTVPLMLQRTEGRGKAMALQVRFTTSSCRTYSGELMATMRGFPAGTAQRAPLAPGAGGGKHGADAGGTGLAPGYFLP